MLTFNELRITPDSKYLIVDVSVKDEPYYNDVFIDSVVIDTQDTYVFSGPSSNPAYTYSNENEGITKVYTTCDCNPVLDEDKSYCFVTDDYSKKNIRLILSCKDLGFSLTDNIFFVYAIASGTPAADTPCGMDNSITMGTVVNLYPIYCKTIQYLKELNDDCNVPKGLIDMYLKIKVLELSVKTGNYTQAISYWNKYFKNLRDKPNPKISRNCGCNN